MSPGAGGVSVSSLGGYAWRRLSGLIRELVEVPSFEEGTALLLNSDPASYANSVDLPVDEGFWAAQSVEGRPH